LTPQAADEPVDPDGQRIDKWIWFARITKTRTLASEVVAGGKIRVNRVRVVKPSQTVRAGDVLTVALGRQVRVLKVMGLGVRRGAPASARTLYEELTVAADPLKPLTSSQSQFPNRLHTEAIPGRREPGSGRPTKKDRREIDRLSGKPR
jgi:ribosome-associated heat shock protein Hsp15